MRIILRFPGELPWCEFPGELPSCELWFTCTMSRRGWNSHYIDSQPLSQAARGSFHESQHKRPRLCRPAIRPRMVTRLSKTEKHSGKQAGGRLFYGPIAENAHACLLFVLPDFWATGRCPKSRQPTATIAPQMSRSRPEARSAPTGAEWLACAACVSFSGFSRKRSDSDWISATRNRYLNDNVFVLTTVGVAEKSGLSAWTRNSAATG